MTAGDHYIAKALELLARADGENDPQIRADFENLAAAFLRLTEQAERNADLIADIDLPSENKTDAVATKDAK